MKIWNKICSYVEPWQTSILAGTFSCITSVFDFLWSIAKLQTEDHRIIIYILVFICFESLAFIIVTFLLFFAIAKKKRCLMIPWMVMALVDISTSLVHEFIQISFPVNRKHAAPCIVAVAGLVVTIINCLIMLFSVIAVFIYYKQLKASESKVMKIKIFPANDNFKTESH